MQRNHALWSTSWCRVGDVLAFGPWAIDAADPIQDLGGYESYDGPVKKFSFVIHKTSHDLKQTS